MQEVEISKGMFGLAAKNQAAANNAVGAAQAAIAIANALQGSMQQLITAADGLAEQLAGGPIGKWELREKGGKYFIAFESRPEPLPAASAEAIPPSEDPK